jgi:hypothetical protein
LLKNDGVLARPFVLENQLLSILLEGASVNKKSKMGLEDRTRESVYVKFSWVVYRFCHTCMLYFIHLQVCPGTDNFVTVTCSGLGVGVPHCGVKFALNYFESNSLKLKLGEKKYKSCGSEMERHMG